MPGYEAPVYVAWSRRNRSALIRIPLYKPGAEQATRAEIRCPDPACNPYLTFAALLHAGLEGIEKGYELPPPMETNLYHLTAGAAARARDRRRCRRRSARRSTSSPRSELMRRALGAHIFDNYVELKRKEWDDYRVQLTEWEMEPLPGGAVGGSSRQRNGLPAQRAIGRQWPESRRALPRRTCVAAATRRAVIGLEEAADRVALDAEADHLLEPSICSIDSTGTIRRRRERKPKPALTASASGTSGAVPYIGHSTLPTTRPRESATRKPPVLRVAGERAHGCEPIPRLQEIPSPR